MTSIQPFGLTRRHLLRATAAAGTAGLLPLAQAQSGWPDKPIRFVVPFNAGGATDIVARLLSEKLAPKLGQPIVVDNRGGAGGILGTDMVAKAAPDGSTFTVALSTSLLINQFLYSKLPYSPQKDLALVSQVAVAPVVLAVHPSVPARNAQELLAYVRANRSKVSYGSWGIGSYAHLGGAFMSRSQNADMAHVAYKGEALMLQDLIGGQIQMAFASALGAKPHADTGRLRLIGVTGEQRMEILPQLPTLAEQGMREDAYRIVGFVGMAAPARTPPEIVQRMAREVQQLCEQPEVKARIVAMGFSVAASTPEAFAAAYRRDAPAWEALVKESGASLD